MQNGHVAYGAHVPAPPGTATARVYGDAFERCRTAGDRTDRRSGDGAPSTRRSGGCSTSTPDCRRPGPDPVAPFEPPLRADGSPAVDQAALVLLVPEPLRPARMGAGRVRRVPGPARLLHRAAAPSSRPRRHLVLGRHPGPGPSPHPRGLRQHPAPPSLVPGWLVRGRAAGRLRRPTAGHRLHSTRRGVDDGRGRGTHHRLRSRPPARRARRRPGLLPDCRSPWTEHGGSYKSREEYSSDLGSCSTAAPSGTRQPPGSPLPLPRAPVLVRPRGPPTAWPIERAAPRWCQLPERSIAHAGELERAPPH